MSRYKNKIVTKDKETKNRHQNMPDYGDIPVHPQDLYIQANDGTRLDIISQQYYQSPKFWWVIALANKMGKGTLYVTPGYQLRIPFNPQRFANKVR
jgi:hypothetical protein